MTGITRTVNALNGARILIRCINGHVEAQEIDMLLRKQITHRWDDITPQLRAHSDYLIRPTLIGAWTENHPIAGALITPAVMTAAEFTRNGCDDGAQFIRRNVLFTEAIAVNPEWRGEHIGLKIKLFCDTLAAYHHAVLMLSIPTNQEACNLNKKAGHTVLPPDIALVLQTKNPEGNPTSPKIVLPRSQSEGMSTWAFKMIGKPATPGGIEVGKIRIKRMPRMVAA
jgi:hypothetical protein